MYVSQVSRNSNLPSLSANSVVSEVTSGPKVNGKGGDTEAHVGSRWGVSNALCAVKNSFAKAVAGAIESANHPEKQLAKTELQKHIYLLKNIYHAQEKNNKNTPEKATLLNKVDMPDLGHVSYNVVTGKLFDSQSKMQVFVSESASKSRSEQKDLVVAFALKKGETRSPTDREQEIANKLIEHVYAQYSHTHNIVLTGHDNGANLVSSSMKRNEEKTELSHVVFNTITGLDKTIEKYEKQLLKLSEADFTRNYKYNSYGPAAMAGAAFGVVGALVAGANPLSTMLCAAVGSSAGASVASRIDALSKGMGQVEEFKNIEDVEIANKIFEVAERSYGVVGQTIPDGKSALDKADIPEKYRKYYNVVTGIFEVKDTTSEDAEVKDTGNRIMILRDDTSKAITIGFAGTEEDPLSKRGLLNWRENINQERYGVNPEATPAYIQAGNLLEALVKQHSTVTFVVTGHSLGGGLVQYAMTRPLVEEAIEKDNARIKAYLFNAVSLSSLTIANIESKPLDNASKNIIHIVVPTDPLSRIGQHPIVGFVASGFVIANKTIELPKSDVSYLVAHGVDEIKEQLNKVMTELVSEGIVEKNKK
jgi:hypothetical protein